MPMTFSFAVFRDLKTRNLLVPSFWLRWSIQEYEGQRRHSRPWIEYAEDVVGFKETDKNFDKEDILSIEKLAGWSFFADIPLKAVAHVIFTQLVSTPHAISGMSAHLHPW
jgi:hypothetical protein